MVILSNVAIELVAGRIERAYWRRHRQGSPWDRPDGRLWELAARSLVESHRAEPWLPIDPELFVICQPSSALLNDPWQELTTTEAIGRYRRRVLKIARGLRRELRTEVRRAEARVRKGSPLEEILRQRGNSLSPLGAYLVAHRAGRADLTGPLLACVHDQHAACPLYRVACRQVLPGSSYPVPELLPGLIVTLRRGPAPRGDGPN